MASSSDKELDHAFAEPDQSVQELTELFADEVARAKCTCGVSSISLRFERASDCPIHVPARVTFDSIAWERVPEQTVCICGDVKGVHRREPVGGATRCGSGNAAAFRAMAARLEAKTKDAPLPVVQGCRCPGFYDVDEPIPWLGFADRLLGEFDTGAPASTMTEKLLDGNGVEIQTTIPARPNLQSRAMAALRWAWKSSGLPMHEGLGAPPRTWNQWLADSKRVWRAWRDAGSPIVAFGKETSFGPAAIPALEDR